MASQLLQRVCAWFGRGPGEDIGPEDGSDSGQRLCEWAEYVRVPEIGSGEPGQD